MIKLDSRKQMRFVVMRVHSEHISKYSLALIGWAGDYWISPRYIKTGYDRQVLALRAASLNSDLHDAGKFLPES